MIDYSPEQFQKSHISKRYMFLLFMSIFMGLIIIWFTFQLNVHDSSYHFPNIIFYINIFDLYFVELFILLILVEILMHISFYTKIISYILIFLFVSIYMLQINSISEGGEYLSLLSIENIDHIYLFINIYYVLFIILFIIIYLLFIYISEKYTSENNIYINYKYIIFLSLIIFILLAGNNNKWFLKKNNVYDDKFVDYILVSKYAPISALYKTIYHDYSVSKKLRSNFDGKELDEIKKLGFYYNPNSKFPLIKETIYTSPPPFVKKESGVPEANIIVIFSEGLSARAIGAYGASLPGITPHIDSFTDSSMLVLNYYNHTAATYRGLLGQLCSIFPVNGGNGWQTQYDKLKNNRYLSIADLLNKENYDTIFLDSHHKRHVSRVDEMISGLGFLRVLTGDEILSRYLQNAEPALKDALSDKQFFDGLIGFLSERAGSDKMDDRFFLGMYNFGTHAFLKRAGDITEYGKGENYVLNNFHSFDRAFGRFWTYFQKSPFLENTIIILTADHCHYPEKPYVMAFNDPDYQGFFMDKIPYIIYDPTRILPKSYNARSSTSLGFAPSLAHYLELENVRNHFLGSSMYEQVNNKNRDIGVGYIGDARHLFIAKEQMIQRYRAEPEFSKLAATLSKFIAATQQIEMDNRLWDGGQQ